MIWIGFVKSDHFYGCGHESIMNGILIMKLQLSSKYTSYSSAWTEVLLISSSEIILWHLNMLLKESVDMKN